MPEVDYQFYTAATCDHKVKSDLSDPDEAWSGLCVIGATTKMTVGVDPRKTKVHKIFVYTKRAQAGGLRELFQQVGRWNRFTEVLDRRTEIICLIDDTHPDVLELQKKKQQSKVAKDGDIGANGLAPITFDGCYSALIKEQTQRCDLSVRMRQMSGEKLTPGAIAEARRNGTEEHFMTQIRACKVKEVKKQARNGDHLSQLLHLAHLRGWSHELCLLQQTVDSGVGIRDDGISGHIDEVHTDTAYAEAYAYIQADIERRNEEAKAVALKNGSVHHDLNEMDFFLTEAFELASKFDRAAPHTAMEKKIIDIFHTLKHYRTFTVAPPDGFPTYQSISFARSVVHLKALLRVCWQDDTGYLETVRESDINRNAIVQNSARVEAIYDLMDLLGVAQTGQTTLFMTSDCRTRVFLNDAGSPWSIWAKKNGWKPKELDDDQQAVNDALKDIEIAMFNGKTFELYKNLTARLKHILQEAGLTIGKERIGNGGQKGDRLFLSQDEKKCPCPSLVEAYHLWHPGDEDFVRVSDFPDHNESMRDLKQAMSEARALQEQHATDQHPHTALGAADQTQHDAFTLEEIINVGALHTLEHSGKKVAKYLARELATIRMALTRSVNEPDKMCIRVTYTKRGQYGRVYGSYPAAMYMSSKVRAALFKGNYWDLDMKGCHPMIMLNIARRPGIDLDLKHLKYYLEHTEDARQELAIYYLRRDTPTNRKAVKALVNSVLNCGGTAGWVLAQQRKAVTANSDLPPREVKELVRYGGNVNESVRMFLHDFGYGREICQMVADKGDHPLIQNIKHHVQQLHRAMRREYPDIFDAAIAAIKLDPKLNERFGGVEERMNGRAFSICMGEIEKRLLFSIVKAAKKIGYRADALIHDGCHIRIPEKRTQMSEGDVGTIERLVKDESGFDIRLAIKPF